MIENTKSAQSKQYYQKNKDKFIGYYQKKKKAGIDTGIGKIPELVTPENSKNFKGFFEKIATILTQKKQDLS